MAKTSTSKSKPAVTNKAKRVRISDVAESSTDKKKASKLIAAAPSSEAVAELPAKPKSALKKSASGKQAEKQKESDFSADVEMLDGFESDSSNDEDSSDDQAEDESRLVEVSTLPKIVTDGKGIQEKLAKTKQQTKNTPGVVYIGRLPKGFEEAQLKSYFEQFGTVNRLRLSRNKKTGNPKHYAFLEFAHESVAKIVVETMDNYLLLGHILVCKIVPQDNVHPTMWQGAGKKFNVMPKNIRERQSHNAVKNRKQQQRISTRLLERQNTKKEKIAALGIDYDFPGYKQSKTQAAIEA